MKKIICILLSVVVLAFTFTACGRSGSEEPDLGVKSGEDMSDFTVSLTDGTTATLSELVKENDLVVLNVFASWCKPCEHEFPEMERVYQENSDRMELLSVSAEPQDTMELIAEYKESHGLSFPMGLAGEELSFLKISAFPTTLFIDHNGQIGFTKVGAFVNEGDFEEKIEYFLSSDYDGKASMRRSSCAAILSSSLRKR